MLIGTMEDRFAGTMEDEKVFRQRWEKVCQDKLSFL